MRKLPIRPLSQSELIVLAAIFLTLTANQTFFRETVNIYPLTGGNFGFLLSLAIVVLCCIALLMCLLSIIFPVRIVVTFFILLAAVTGFYTDQFGVVIDTVMLENVMQTDRNETRDLLNTDFVIRLLLLGMGSSVLFCLLPVRSLAKLFAVQQLARTGIVILLLASLTIFLFSDQYASFFRQHKILRYYTNPLTPIYSAAMYSAKKFRSTAPTTIKLTASDADIAFEDDESELIIVVVGETARRDRFSLNGYHRKTNPELEKLSRLISYSNITSCGTSTAVSVPCMFSASGHEDFDIDIARNEENILDILKRAGVNVLWRDNNSSSKGVADRVSYEDFRNPDLNPICDSECRDLGMLAGLQDYIDKQKGDILIVLHQRGNHGPAYFKRYPPEFERFTPACRSLNISDCTPEEISNAYDNAILYTDYFLSKVIELLQRNTPRFETAMLYVSDHGESLGEHGLFLHGAPYLLAPREQTEVPVILWLGESTDIEMNEALAQKDKKSSHDAVFYSLLAAFEVESSIVQINNQLFKTTVQKGNKTHTLIE